MGDFPKNVTIVRSADEMMEMGRIVHSSGLEKQWYKKKSPWINLTVDAATWLGSCKVFYVIPIHIMQVPPSRDDCIDVIQMVV